jgi:hypothetical protein
VMFLAASASVSKEMEGSGTVSANWTPIQTAIAIDRSVVSRD